jgi:thiosulfate/3-mercaptopyruvate sulfurtransferase
MPSPVISVSELELQDRAPTVLDVRWELATGAQRTSYEAGHIPGAAFVNLDRELSGTPGTGGRHPLPATDDFTAAMRAAGVSNDRPVVVYDAGTGLGAARAWWLLRYFGHPAPEVLDGGLAAWTGAGRPEASGTESPAPGDFVATPGGMPVLDAAGAADLAASGVLLDARASERFRGETEPLDPVGGHIPGARNWPMARNLDAAGRLLGPDELRQGFAELTAEPHQPVGAYCGSGITAAHAVLALELAGIRAALYPGSWSEWITDPARPVATGPESQHPR